MPFLGRFISLFFFFILLLIIAAPGTRASVITVNTLVDENNTGTNCSLREAIVAANTNAAFGGCIAGGGVDDISVQVRGTIDLTSSLPTITAGVNINGGGADVFTLAGNDTFRLMNILMASPDTMVLSGIGFTRGRKSSGVNAAALEFNNNGTLTLSSCDFYGNSGPAAGAADGSSVLFSNASAQLNILGSTFRSNGVEHVVEIGNTPLAITNTTISNNTGTGAGLFIFGGMPAGTVTNSTISNNNQGIWHANSGGASTITVSNSIVSQNGNINLRRTPAACPGVINNIVSAGHNIFDTNPTGGNNLCSLGAGDMVNTDPGLGPIADNGGPVQTRALLVTSPARDAVASGFPANDARGALRPLYGSADIGAYEFSSYVSNAGDSGTFSLRDAIANSPVNAAVTFDPAFFLVPRTITLASPLVIGKGIRVNGPGANLLTIAGNSTFRLLDLSSSSERTIQLNDMSFTAGLRAAGTNSSVIEFNETTGSLEINRCEFFGNGTASVMSPILFTNLAKKITINASTIQNNQTDHILFIGDTDVDIINTTISTHPGTGAAVFLGFCGAVVNVTSSTITRNPQGIWNACTAGLNTATVKNTLLSQNGNLNLRRSGPSPSANPIFTAGNNLIDDNTASQFVNSAPTDRTGPSMNPQLAPLGYYGGGTRTHALKTGSAALDFGTGSGVPPLDQRGSARVIGGAADIGAFERNVTFDQTTLPNGGVNHPYNNGTPVQLTATRQSSFAAAKGDEPFTVESIAVATFAIVPVSGQVFPPGLSLSADGKITGMPTTAGTYTFTLAATDTDGMSGVGQFSMLILAPPTAAAVSVSGRVLAGAGAGLTNAQVLLTDQHGIARTAITSSFGYYRFDDVAAGETYVVSVASKRFQFSPLVVAVADEITGLDLVAAP